MNTALELYNYLDEIIPISLSMEWDNDGLMCSSGAENNVERVMLTLDVTESAVDYAVNNCFDTIISHHPLIFKPLKNIKNNKLVTLIQNNITVMSFHTRLDAVDGGVNTQFADLLDLTDIETFGEGDIGRVGSLQCELEFNDFINRVKNLLNCTQITAIKTQNTVKRVAVLGGDGKDFYDSALKTGADTYLTGNLSYNMMIDAAESTMNVIEAGHYQSENFICQYLENLVLKFDKSIKTHIFESNKILYL